MGFLVFYCFSGLLILRWLKRQEQNIIQRAFIDENDLYFWSRFMRIWLAVSGLVSLILGIEGLINLSLVTALLNLVIVISAGWLCLLLNRLINLYVYSLGHIDPI